MTEVLTGTVLIADDHNLISASLVMALRARGVDARQCTVTDVDAVLAEAARHTPGAVLLDLDLGIGADGLPVDGADLVAPLRSDGWSVLVLTGSTDRRRIARAVAGGAAGWVSKSESFEVLVERSLDVLAGRPVLDRAERAELVALDRARLAEERAAVTRLQRLSGREREVLARLAAGSQAAAIAAEFVTSLATVRSQIRSILSKLEVGSQLAAVALANKFPHELCRPSSTRR